MKITASGFLDFCFVSLNIIFFCSFNSVIQAVTGRGEFASPVILLTCLSIIATTRFRPAALLRSPILLYLALFFTYNAIGVAMRLYYEPLEAFYRPWNTILRNLTTNLVVILAYLHYFHYRMVSRPDPGRLLKLIYYPLLAGVLILIGQRLMGVTSFDASVTQTNRSLGVFANPNVAATAANLALVVTIDRLFRRKNNWWIGLIVLAVVIVGNILPFSRTGIIVMLSLLLISMLYFIWYKSVDQQRRWVRTLVFTGIPTALVLLIALNYAQLKQELNYYQRTRVETMEALFLRGEVNSKTTAQRSVIFEASLDMIKRRPLLGNGIGALNDLAYLPGAHNTYLLVLGNSGVLPALLLVVLLFFTLPFYIIARRRTGYLILGFTTVTALTFMTSHSSFEDKILLLMFLFPVALAAYPWPTPPPTLSPK